MSEPVNAMDQGLQVPTRADMGHGTPVRDAQQTFYTVRVGPVFLSF